MSCLCTPSFTENSDAAANVPGADAAFGLSVSIAPPGYVAGCGAVPKR
jgi:hypothetical protein